MTTQHTPISNLERLMIERGVTAYSDLHRWSVAHREDFWTLMIERLGIVFDTPAARLVDLSCGVHAPRWLPDAKLNISNSCFRADADATAIVFQSEDGVIERMSFSELNRLSNRVANGLAALGLKRGAAIAIDMSMTPDAVAIYLGMVKAGCAAIGIADSFAPEEIATRLRIGEAQAIFTQDVIRRGGKLLPLYEKVIAAHAPRAVILPAGETSTTPFRAGDISWKHFLSSKESFASVSCNPDDVTNILFSSGTTGDPKAIPWDHTTPIKCAADGFLHHDIHPGDVIAWPTSLGWMMGPWLIYAGFINKAAIALYDGAPGTREFCEFVRDAKVTMLGVVPSLVKVWRNHHCLDDVQWTHLRVLSSTGECSNADDYAWLMEQTGNKPIIEYCGGTEIGGGYITGTVVQPQRPATFSTPALGLDFVILDEAGKPTENGELFLIPPSIGLSTRLLNRNHDEVYYEGTPPGPNGEMLRRHGDQMEVLPGGYFRAHGRADDTMNLGGIKVSSAEIERAANTTPGVHETAAIAVNPRGGGPSLLVMYAVLQSDAVISKENFMTAMQQAIRHHLNPLFKIHDLVLVDTLPRTASNKVMRRALRQRYTAM